MGRTKATARPRSQILQALADLGGDSAHVIRPALPCPVCGSTAWTETVEGLCCNRCPATVKAAARQTAREREQRRQAGQG